MVTNDTTVTDTIAVSLCSIRPFYSLTHTHMCTRTPQEVSLEFLLSPLWVLQDAAASSRSDTPLLVRKHSIRGGGRDAERSGVSATPRPHSAFHSGLKEHRSVSGIYGASLFPWQLQFQENHSPAFVVLHYHPLALDNYEYFVGKNTTTITPCGYMVRTNDYH